MLVVSFPVVQETFLNLNSYSGATTTFQSRLRSEPLTWSLQHLNSSLFVFWCVWGPFPVALKSFYTEKFLINSATTSSHQSKERCFTAVCSDASLQTQSTKEKDQSVSVMWFQWMRGERNKSFTELFPVKEKHWQKLREDQMNQSLQLTQFVLLFPVATEGRQVQGTSEDPLHILPSDSLSWRCLSACFWRLPSLWCTFFVLFFRSDFSSASVPLTRSEASFPPSLPSLFYLFNCFQYLALTLWSALQEQRATHHFLNENNRTDIGSDLFCF